MKKFLRFALCAAGLLQAASASAQYYYATYVNAGQNPGGLNVSAEETNQPGWGHILIGRNTMLTAPAWSPVQRLPIPFNFNGQAVSYYKVSSSGVLTFDTLAVTPPSGTNTALPSANIPNKSVCVWGLAAKANNYIDTTTFGSAPNRQHWIQFNHFSESGNTNTVDTYWSIVLEEGTNKIYVVDQSTQFTNVSPAQTLTVGVQIDASTAVQLPASPNVNTTTTYTDDDTPADNTYYTFTPGLRPANDLRLLTVALPPIISRQNPIAITGTLQNLGSQTATSYTVGYKVDGGRAVTGTVTGANVASLASGAFTHPISWQPSASGRYSLQVWLALPNGQADADHNNDTLSTSVLVGDSTMRRLVVEECFTSSTCPPCNPGNINVENVNRLNPNKQVVVKYQQNFPSPGNDPYYTAETGARRGFYGINAIPYMMLDGGWNENSQSFTTGILNQYQAKPALARIYGTYTISSRGYVNAAAVIRPLFATTAGQLVAQMIITERRTTLNRRTNGETQFFQVVKKMLPNQNGTILPALASGQNYNLNQVFATASLPLAQAVEHYDSLRVVVFVQDVITKEIYQGAYLALRSLTATRNADSGTSFELAPNPSTGQTNLFLTLRQAQTVRIEVLDVLGRQVMERQLPLGVGQQQVNLDLSHQSAGVYTVRLTTSEGVHTDKLSLQ